MAQGGKDVHVLSSRTNERVTLQDKEDFADVIKLRILSWGGGPGLSGWPRVITRVLTRERTGELESEKQTWSQKQWSQCWGSRGQECRLWKLEKASKSLPMRLQREPSPADTLILYFQPPELSDDKFVLFQATEVSAPVGSAYRWLFQLP